MAGCTRLLRKFWDWRRSIPERCCLNCDFLMRKDNPTHPFSIPESDRKCLGDKLSESNPRRMTEDILTQYQCYKKVWVVGGIEASKTWDCSQVIEDREGNCFFYPYEYRRPFQATEELERRTKERCETEKDRKLTRRAFWVAFVALSVSIVTTFANLAWNIWVYFYPSKP